MKSQPLVSLIILNWNGKKWLERCLPTVRKVRYPNKEIILVNNGSTDDSAEFVKKNFPEIKIVEIKKNRGYAGANNVGVKSAKGKYVLLLNNDTELTPNFLDKLVADLENDSSIGIVQPQIRSLIRPKLLDSVCSFLTVTGYMYHYGYMKPWKDKKYQTNLFSYSIKGACCLISRKDYLTLGGLDEDFVCYVEETDLCHRMWLSGKKVMYDPESVMYHWGGGDMQVMTKNETTMFRSFRNRFFSYIKNLSIKELCKILPSLFIFSEIFIIILLMKGEFKKALGAQIGVLSVPFYLPNLLKKRRFIQKKIRKVSDDEIKRYIYKNPRLSYYFLSVGNPSAYKD